MVVTIKICACLAYRRLDIEILNQEASTVGFQVVTGSFW